MSHPLSLPPPFFMTFSYLLSAFYAPQFPFLLIIRLEFTHKPNSVLYIILILSHLRPTLLHAFHYHN